MAVAILSDWEFRQYDKAHRRRDLELLQENYGIDIVRANIEFVGVEVNNRRESFGDPMADIAVITDLEPISIYAPGLDSPVARR